NLLSNAIKFTDRGRIHLSAEVVGTTPERCELAFCIADTGVGIDTSSRDRIFERFVQEDESAGRRFGGSGLGLAICKLLVEMFGGRIWVDSKKGMGSRFHFTIC